MTNGWSPNNTSKIILKKFKKIKTMSRTKEEIDRQINGLEQEKRIVPEKSLFGTNNHLIIDYQIKVLKGEVYVEPRPIQECKIEIE